MAEYTGEIEEREFYNANQTANQNLRTQTNEFSFVPLSVFHLIIGMKRRRKLKVNGSPSKAFLFLPNLG